jgi:hypothetical protein
MLLGGARILKGLPGKRVAQGSLGSGRNDLVPRTTFALEEMLARGANHLRQMVDGRGRTYFDVFLTEPPEAVTDWPDFVDLPARYWEACAMVSSALPSAAVPTARIRPWLFSHFEADGLAYRPDSPISEHVAEMFDQSRLMYALVTWSMCDPEDAEVRRRLAGLAGGLMRRATMKEDYAYIDKIGLYYGGTLIRPMTQAGLLLNRPEWVEFAVKVARGLTKHSDLIGENGSFKGHVHGALCAIAGMLACGIATNDTYLRDRARAAFDYARSISTDFGFVPELAQRDDDLIACETCALMDYLDVALLLARHVDPVYWGVVERVARNHLWESQIRDASWIGAPGGKDEADVIRTDLQTRLPGGFAGWSGPHCTLAYSEELGEGWTRTEEKRPLYLGKVRALQNCCAGAGMRAVHQVWSNIVTTSRNAVSVNVSLDRATPEAQVTSFLPFDGKVRITVRRDCTLRWRRPDHCPPEAVRVSTEPLGNHSNIQVEGAYLNLGPQSSGNTIELAFPLPERSERIVIGNAGFQQYEFHLHWRGDTVMSINPSPQNASAGFSRVMRKSVPTSYADRGRGPIYQRDKWASGLKVGLAQIPTTPSKIDWYRL